MMNAFSSILSVNNLSVYRDETSILNSIDWSIHSKEQWVLLGANGSGKTSLLNALTGYLTPSSGEIEILGQRYGQTDWREVRKKIGLVSTSLHSNIQPQETALKIVASGKNAVINYWGSIEENDLKKARTILRDVQCDPFEERAWTYLSQGEKQRVLIGRALMSEHKLLFLDEPCSGLDIVAREKFLTFLGRVTNLKHAPTLVLVTHHIEEIMPAFSHVLVLKAGRVLACGEKSILSSQLLSEAFQASVQLQEFNGRLKANVTSISDSVF